MKKLNKKGFTLIELLAVIVVLAIVLVVTIPSVLSSMGSAKKQQFENAVATINEYIKKQLDACNLGNEDLVEYDTEIVTPNGTTCTVTSTVENIVRNAGYTYAENENGDSTGSKNKSDFYSITISGGKVTDAKSPAGSKFGPQTYKAS